jgi:hypothetical protein
LHDTHANRRHALNRSPQRGSVSIRGNHARHRDTSRAQSRCTKMNNAARQTAQAIECESSTRYPSKPRHAARRWVSDYVLVSGVELVELSRGQTTLPSTRRSRGPAA